MIWLTWRQFRVQAITGAVILLAAVAAMLLNARTIGHLWTDSGAATCGGRTDCAGLNSFLSSVRAGTAQTLYIGGTALLYLVPPLTGAFWGAPLVARELESGTHRLAWSQSVTRDRWLAVKLTTLGGAGVAFAGLLSLVVTWSSHRVDAAGTINRLSPVLFGARGVAPIGYAAFAFALGVAAGILTRRTVPAIVVTLAVYTGVALTMALKLRAYLIPPVHLTQSLASAKDITQLRMTPGGSINIVQDPGLPGAWIIGNQTITPSGRVFDGPANMQYCGDQASPKACLDWIHTLNLRQAIVYQPAGRFWALQWAEAGVFLALAALLVAFGFWWLRRRSA